MDVSDTVNRRRYDRFTVPPMYSRVVVQRGDGMRLERLEGHVYDLSEAGLRLELDEPLCPGERVSLHLGLPGEPEEIVASGQVVWVGSEEDDPGPRRAALRIERFHGREDRDRLLRFLGSGLAHRAA